jgi:transcriptional regulator with XRE-family HTH domain
MNYERKELLARTGDGSNEAAAIRLQAARKAIGLSQTALGEFGGVKVAAINNMEKARSYPARSVMMYLFREHRIDFNFLIAGSFSQLPQDVQDRLFSCLEAIEASISDPKSN